MSDRFTSTDFSDSHRTTYDKAAHEYEERVEDQRPGVEYVVRTLSKYKKEGNVLDVGCGVGLSVQVLAENGFNVTGIDISPKMIEFAQHRNPYQKLSVNDFFNFQARHKFDVIFASAFIHLFPKTMFEAEILTKMHSLLKPNGILCVGTTKSKISSEGHEIKIDYKRKYNRFRKRWTFTELEQTIANNHFDVLQSIEFPYPYNKIGLVFLAKRQEIGNPMTFDL